MACESGSLLRWASEWACHATVRRRNVRKVRIGRDQDEAEWLRSLK